MSLAINTLVCSLFKPRLCSLYRLSGRTLSNRSPELLPKTYQYEPSPTELNPFSPVTVENKEFLNELTPAIKRSYNFAAYIRDSITLQELVKLGVSLYDIENTNNEAARHILKLDFQNDCVPYIKFLVDHGLKERNLGRFISEFPDIFREPLEELEYKIKYYRSKNFSDKLVAKSLNRSSHFISHPLKTIDFKLGQFQIEFNLKANDLRDIISWYPELIAFDKEQFTVIKFSLVEDFGFGEAEIHEILKNQPKLLGFTRFCLIERLELIHNVIGLSHSTIVKFPKLITGPKLDITHRHEYLKKLNRNQYDPSKPLYVPPSALYKPRDLEFCLRYSKTSVEDYILFLKSC